MCFKKKETNNVKEMETWLQTYMLTYLKDRPADGDDLIPIFSSTKVFITDAGEKAITKLLKKNHLSVEEGIVNILQNHALVAIEPKSGAAFIAGEDDPVHDLYDALNKYKYDNHYISYGQYKENEKVGNKAALMPPGGMWL